jgi:hypothetical protein
MSRRKIKAGSTSNLIPIFIQDTSSTTGAGLGSLVYNSSGLAAKYRRDGAGSWTAITLATATAGTWASGGFIADGGSVTGGYEIGLPDAACAASAKWVQIQIYGATNMLPVLIEIELDAVDYQDAVAFGLSMVPVDIRKALGTAVTLDANNVLNVSTKYVSGTLQTAGDIYGYLTTNLGALGANLSAIPKT